MPRKALNILLSKNTHKGWSSEPGGKAGTPGGDTLEGGRQAMRVKEDQCNAFGVR